MEWGSFACRENYVLFFDRQAGIVEVEVTSIFVTVQWLQLPTLQLSPLVSFVFLPSLDDKLSQYG